MANSVPSVEERLRAVLTYLAASKRNAILMKGPANRRPFDNPEAFAEWVAGQSIVIAGEVAAVKAALPPLVRTYVAPPIGPESFDGGVR